MNRNSSNYQNTLGVGSVSHDGWRVFKRIGAKLIHPSGGEFGNTISLGGLSKPPPRLEGFVGFLIIIGAIFIRLSFPSPTLGADSGKCTNFTITDEGGKPPDRIDANAQKLTWSMTLQSKDPKRKFNVYTDGGHCRPTILSPGTTGPGCDFYSEGISSDNTGLLKGVIERNHYGRPFTAEGHKIIVETDTGGGNYRSYCRFTPAYFVKAPPRQQSATCELIIESLPDPIDTKKSFTPNSDILVHGTVYPKGFTGHQTELSFPGISFSLPLYEEKAFIVTGPGEPLIIPGGFGYQKVNYPGGIYITTEGDAPILFDSDIGIQPDEGTYTVTVTRASDPPFNNSIPYPQDSISVWPKEVILPEDPYGRPIWAPMTCRARFVIKEDGGYFITPVPTRIPPPQCRRGTFPDREPECKPGDCMGQCNACLGCPGYENNLPDINLPNLKPLCEQLPIDYQADCKACVDNSNASKKGIWTAIGCIPTDMNQFLEQYVFKFGPGIAGGIAFLYFLYGAFLILTSAGDPEKVAQGKEILVSALSGLLLIIFSVFLLRVVAQDILSLPGFGQSSTPNSSSQIPPQCRRGTFLDRELECKPGDCNGNCKECPGC